MTTLSVVIQKDIDGEYRVPAPCGTEAGSYYTDDREDALGEVVLKKRLTRYQIGFLHGVFVSILAILLAAAVSY